MLLRVALVVQRSFFLVVSATLSVCVRFFSVVLHGFHVVFLSL